ncbi:MAG TPA: rRNA maturation RNase YbeY [Firmicutes bacterium]|nr:rRNA maturation RNase YbeY [Bacillota bacterium]
MPVLISYERQDALLSDRELDMIEKIIEKGLSLAGYDPGAIEVSVALVDDEKIRQLNRDFRGIDAPTDVLSFPMDDPREPGALKGPGDAPLLLGDIVVSLETARRQGDEFGHGLSREVGYLVAHGLLHLLGYDHEDPRDKAKMREAEERLLSAFVPREQDDEPS